MGVATMRCSSVREVRDIEGRFILEEIPRLKVGGVRGTALGGGET